MEERIIISDGEEIKPEEYLKRVYHNTADILRLHTEYRGLIKKFVAEELRGFIPRKFFTLNRSHISGIYSKFGYLYGRDMEIKNDALILPSKGILFCSTSSVGNGSRNPIYELFRNFADSKRYEFKHSNDLSNPFQIQ